MLYPIGIFDFCETLKINLWRASRRRCRISTPTACKNFCRLFLKRKCGLARFCAKFDTQCCRWLKNKHFSTRPWFVIYLWQCTLGATTTQAWLKIIARTDDCYFHLTCVYYTNCCLFVLRLLFTKHTRVTAFICATAYSFTRVTLNNSLVLSISWKL